MYNLLKTSTMKNKISTIILMLFATAVCGLSSCSDEADAPFNGAGTPATITVAGVGNASATAFSVTITPSANAAAYTFAIGTPADYALFVSRSSTLKTIKDVSGNRDTTITFDELDPGAEYAVFAQAYTAEGYRSEIATFTVPTKSASVSINIDEVTSMYAIVTTEMHGDVGGYIALAASKEVYGEMVDMWAEYGDSETVLLLDLLDYGEASYYNSDVTDGWLLNGYTNYEDIFVVLPIATDGTPLAITRMEFTSPAFIPGLLLPYPGTIAVDAITDETAHVVITPGPETFGYYAGLIDAVEYDALSPDEAHYLWYEYLPFYGSPVFGEDDDIWQGLDPGTEYVIVVTPFNLNGADGYGPFYAERFTTTGTAPAPAPVPGSIGSKRHNGNSLILPGGQVQPYKKSLTKEALKKMEIKHK
jgi:hypothetical protein